MEDEQEVMEVQDVEEGAPPTLSLSPSMPPSLSGTGTDDHSSCSLLGGRQGRRSWVEEVGEGVVGRDGWKRWVEEVGGGGWYRRLVEEVGGGGWWRR